MARHKRTGSDLCGEDWTWESNDQGAWPIATLKAASDTESARQLQRIAMKLDTLISLMNELGHDGIHALIQGEARRVSVRERKLRRRLAAARKRARRRQKS